MTIQPTASYNNPYHDDNVYGHVIKLLGQNLERDDLDGVHLDIGCGYAAIAEPITKQFGLVYIGVDADATALQAVAARGFEVHEVKLSDEDATFAGLKAVIGDRRLRSITMLDTLEHLVDGDAVLRALRRLALDHTAYVVLSVPNVTHADVGLKLAFGEWSYTDVGLLDHTHLRLFSSQMLQGVLRSAGLHAIGSEDVHQQLSDQHFPIDHPALARGTTLHQFLASLRKGIDDADDIYQFVRICVPGPRSSEPTFVGLRELDRPFLSIVTRTQGLRLHTLREVFTALAGQIDTDFEVLVMGHRLTDKTQASVERILDDNPSWLRGKVRLIKVERGNRTHPINVGFEAAAGRYIALLDDDDLPMANWVESFRRLAAEQPGRLLRTIAVRQTVRNVRIASLPGLRAEGGLETRYPPSFDFLEHLRVNLSPPVCVAFPRGVFHDLKIRFDETLTTTEDWDYIMRVAAIVGVASSETITCIYRWWQSDESSRTVHLPDEWLQNHNRIFQKLDTSLVLLPEGTTRRIRFLLDEHDRMEAALHKSGASLDPVSRRSIQPTGGLAPQLEHLRLIHAVLFSTSWRVTSPLRLLARVLGKPSLNPDALWHLTPHEAEVLLLKLRASTSWRLTAPLRRLGQFEQYGSRAANPVIAERSRPT